MVMLVLKLLWRGSGEPGAPADTYCSELSQVPQSESRAKADIFYFRMQENCLGLVILGEIV